MKYEIEHERANQLFNKILENENFLFSNYKLWSSDLDIWLKDWVIIYNFNFSKIADKFQDTIGYPLKYDYTEEEVRKHWAFLHAARSLGVDITETYYDDIKKKYKKEFENKEKHLEEQKLKDLEKEVEAEGGVIEETRQKSPVKDKQVENLGVEEEVNTIMENKENTRSETNQSKTDVDTSITVQNMQKEEPQIPEAKPLVDDILTHNKELNFYEDDETINQLFNKKVKVDTNSLAKEVEIIQNKLKESEDKIEDSFPINSLNDKEQTLHFANMEHDLMNTPDIDDYVLRDDKLKKEFDRLAKFQDFTMKSLNYLMPKMGQAPAEEPNLEDINENVKLEDTSNKIKDFMKSVRCFIT
jgi:hypothetical protein